MAALSCHKLYINNYSEDVYTWSGFKQCCLLLNCTMFLQKCQRDSLYYSTVWRSCYRLFSLTLHLITSGTVFLDKLTATLTNNLKGKISHRKWVPFLYTFSLTIKWGCGQTLAFSKQRKVYFLKLRHLDFISNVSTAITAESITVKISISSTPQVTVHVLISKIINRFKFTSDNLKYSRGQHH